jgi:hypothetical protein
MFKKVLGKLTKVWGEPTKPVILRIAAEGSLRILPDCAESLGL